MINKWIASLNGVEIWFLLFAMDVVFSMLTKHFKEKEEKERQDRQESNKEE